MIRRTYEYDVSFSFAEEDNAFVQEVANHLKHRNPNYYYYKEDLVKNWGKDLEKYLGPIYSRQSRLCVIFVSAAYRDKVWTKYELSQATAKAKRNIQEYILPFKLDDTELPEIPPSIKYLSSKEIGADGLVDAICRKIDEHKKQDKFLIRLQGLMRYYSRQPVYRAAAVLLFFLFSGTLLWDRLTPVDRLTTRLFIRHQKHIRAVCRDGSFTESTGRGTCAHHRGVAKKVNFPITGKSMEECRAEAKDISWIGE